MLRIAGLLVCLFLCAGWTHGRGPETFFVSQSGNDSNDGLTSNSAWASISKVNSSSFNSGDTVAFQGSSTFSGGIVITDANAPSNLIISSYGVGQPTISSGNSNPCVTANEFNGIVINNLNCVGGGIATNTTWGILIARQSSSFTKIAGPTITNNTISGYGGGNVSGSSSGEGCIAIVSTINTPGAFYNVVFNNNVLHDCNQALLIVDSSASGPHLGVINNITVNGNVVHDIPGTSCSGGANCITGFGLLMTGVQTGTVQNNLVHDFGSNSDSAAGGPEGIVTNTSDSFLMQFNEVYHGGDNHSPSLDGQGMDFDILTSNSTMQYNYIHDNCVTSHSVGTCQEAETIQSGSGNVIRWNIFASSQGGVPAFQMGINGTGRTVEFYNNTLTHKGNGQVFTGGSTGNTIIFANNIFDNVDTQTINYMQLNGTITLTGNDYHDTGGNLNVEINGTGYTSLAALQAAGFEKVGGNPVGVDADPNLTGPFSGTNCGGYVPPCPSAFQLTASSPAGKGNGLNLNSVYGYNVGTQDLYGNTITNTTLPIGAAANK